MTPASSSKIRFSGIHDYIKMQILRETADLMYLIYVSLKLHTQAKLRLKKLDKIRYNTLNKLKLMTLMTLMTPMKLLSNLLLFGLLISCSKGPLKIRVESQVNSPRVSYAVALLEQLEIENLKLDRPLTITATIDSVNLIPEAFQIKLAEGQVEVIGGDDTGIMYGLLEIKEQILQW